MAETWDLSLLIDTSTKIFDARGMTGHHLGVEARNLPDHFFIEYVDPDNRGPIEAKLESGLPPEPRADSAAR